MACSNSCNCCHGIWRPTWGRDRILPGDTGRSWYFASPATFALIRIVFSIIGVIFLIYSALSDKPPPQPSEPARFAQGWFAYWKFYSHWTLALCSIYCTSAALFSYALWKHERGPTRQEDRARYAWEMDVHENRAAAVTLHHHVDHALEEGDHSTTDGLTGNRSTTSSNRSSTRFIRGRNGSDPAFDSEGEPEIQGLQDHENHHDHHHHHHHHDHHGHRMRSSSQGPSSRSSSVQLHHDDSDDDEELQALDTQPLEFPTSLQIHRPHRNRSPSALHIAPGSPRSHLHHGHRRRISLGELCLWLMYQTVWAAAIFCASTFWIFIGIGCLPRKGCTSVAANFWIAQVINLAFITMEMSFNKLPFIPFHSVLTLGYCVLWLVFSAILWSVTGNWMYPRSSTHGQLYSAVTFWPGWIFLNVGAFFVGLGIEWALSHWIFPNKHSIKDPLDASDRSDLDLQSA